jgi:magnesium-transporting ATPase (P-type)
VIALARKNLPETMNYRKIQRMERTDSEKDLTFLGLIIMENR